MFWLLPPFYHKVRCEAIMYKKTPCGVCDYSAICHSRSFRKRNGVKERSLSPVGSASLSTVHRFLMSRISRPECVRPYAFDGLSTVNRSNMWSAFLFSKISNVQGIAIRDGLKTPAHSSSDKCLFFHKCGALSVMYRKQDSLPVAARMSASRSSGSLGFGLQ